VRHAIAEQRDSAQWPDDAKRPLSEDGIRRFRRAAGGLRRLVPDVDAVLSSGYVRAWKTAELLHEVAGWPAPEELATLEAPRPPAEAATALRARTETSIALVGHEPQLSLLASLLLTGSQDELHIELKKGGVIAIAFGERIETGAASLLWSVTPKTLRALD
jgi:phosphohistidine phosphatase